MNRKEKLVLIALACVFVLGVVFSIKDLNVSVMNTEERAAYDQQTEVLRTGLIDVNTANAMELQLLKGIGTTKADAIVKYRETNGSFSKKEDIMSVPGIGPATYEKIKDRLQITEKSMDESKQEQHHSEEERININRASRLQLEKLPGIGPVKARSIVEYRELNGDFNDLPDLILVKGIGEKTFEQIKPMITISH
jgi:competence protein ComEA